MRYTGCKVFSATKSADRAALGDVLTEWLRQNAQLEVVDTVTLQSSDNAYHCFTIVVFTREKSS